MSTFSGQELLATRRHARDRYTSVACLECQRRKQKCSGHRICTVCRVRGVECVYPKVSERRSRRKAPQPAVNIRSEADQQESSTQSLGGRVRELEMLLQRINELSNSAQFDPNLINSTNQDATSPSQNAKIPQDVSMVTLTSSHAHVLPLPEHSGNDWQISEDLSLSNAFRTTCVNLGIDPMRNPSLLEFDPDEILPIPFPELLSARKLLDVCTERLGIYVPLPDSNYSKDDFLKQIVSLPASERHTTALVKRKDLVLLSHLYLALALGSCLQQYDDFSRNTIQGWSFYCEGFRLIDKVTPKPHQLVDLAKFHLLRATYLLQAGLSQSAMEAIWAAVCLAIKSGLNDELSWATCSPSERMSRRRLWWSIYFMDRRVAEKCHKPYAIRDEEVAVDEFEVRETPNLLSPGNSVTGEVTESDQFLQVLIRLGKLWANIWDTFFSLSALRSRTPGTSDEVEIMDIRLLHLQQNLPPWLRVHDDDIDGTSNNYKFDIEAQRRLVIYTRINLLRISIRQNTASRSKTNADACRFCMGRAMAVTKSITAFISRRSPAQIQPMAYFLTSALVECAYHISKIMENKALEPERPIASKALADLTQYLVALGKTSPTARRILVPLNLSCDEILDKCTLDGDISSIEPAWIELNERDIENQDLSEAAVDWLSAQTCNDTIFPFGTDYKLPVLSHSSNMELDFLENSILVGDGTLGQVQSNSLDATTDDFLVEHAGTNWKFW